MKKLILLLTLLIFLPLRVEAKSTDAELLALVCAAEAIGESEYGQRLVIDTVLNRVDSEKFPGDISGVIYQKNQYCTVANQVPEELVQLAQEELEHRTNYDCLYFRTKKYHNFGTPLIRVGSHFFSGE